MELDISGILERQTCNEISIGVGVEFSLIQREQELVDLSFIY